MIDAPAGAVVGGSVATRPLRQKMFCKLTSELSTTVTLHA
jgi:hypothetical protein